MPFPRFHKLPQEKRERLLDIAAQEFATRGFEDASVNRILERAQMSKGAAYYYFEDKVDLFFTVVQYCNERLKLSTRISTLQRSRRTTSGQTFANLLAGRRLGHSSHPGYSR